MGWLVVPCTLILALVRRDLLLPWTAFVSIFQAASVASITINGHFPVGVQPGYFAALVSGCVLLLLPLSGEVRWRHPLRLRPAYVALGLFAGYAWFSSYWVTKYFSGRVYVNPPRSHVAGVFPLAFSGSNIDQDISLALALLLFAVVCESIYTARSGRLWRAVIRGWLGGGILAAGVGLYQVAAFRFGMPYPSTFFNSNPVYSQEFSTTLAGALRLSGTFSEPSIASFYLSAVFGYGLWRLVLGRRTLLVWLAVVLCGVSLLLTTSTTAYLTLPIVVGAVAAGMILRRRHSAQMAIGGMWLSGLLIAGVLVLFANRATVDRILLASLWNKAEGISYSTRVGSLETAMTIARSTYGLGAGWGSTRAASLPFNILGNVGIFGLAAFLAAMGLILHTARSGLRWLQGDMRAEMGGVLVALLAMAATGTMAVPDLFQVPAWMLLALGAGLGLRGQGLGQALGAARGGEVGAARHPQ